MSAIDQRFSSAAREMLVSRKDAHAIIIRAPVDLLEWIEEKRPDVEDVRTNVPILLNICKMNHPPWGTDWGPWLREKYYR